MICLQTTASLRNIECADRGDGAVDRPLWHPQPCRATGSGTQHRLLWQCPRERLAQEREFPEPYAEMCQSDFARLASASDDEKTGVQDVAVAIWRVATDPTAPTRGHAGADAVALFTD